MGNKEPCLRDGGAVHLLSDARRWKSGPSREFPRTRPLAPRAGRRQAGYPARGRRRPTHGNWELTVGPQASLWQRRGRAGFGGRPSGELGFPNAVAVPPPTEPKSKVLRLGARARKRLEMMSQKPGALLVPLPRGPGAGRGQARWAGRWMGQEEEGTRRPELRLSRLLRARRCNEPALPPPFLSKAGAGLRKLSLSAAPPTFDPGCRLVLKLWPIGLNPHC